MFVIQSFKFQKELIFHQRTRNFHTPLWLENFIYVFCLSIIHESDIEERETFIFMIKEMQVLLSCHQQYLPPVNMTEIFHWIPCFTWRAFHSSFHLSCHSSRSYFHLTSRDNLVRAYTCKDKRIPRDWRDIRDMGDPRATAREKRFERRTMNRRRRKFAAWVTKGKIAITREQSASSFKYSNNRTPYTIRLNN